MKYGQASLPTKSSQNKLKSTICGKNNQQMQTTTVKNAMKSNHKRNVCSIEFRNC